ncbi:MAG: hypothetical protein J1F63_10795 [Oscillospiraceae bacterium]|nr:hypothetical protein [Oscillospiraceae bacterium]
MFKKITLAAALLCCAAISPAAYADVGSAIGGAANGIANAGEDIVNGAENATRDILNGFTADDTNPGIGIGGSSRTTGSGNAGDSSNGTANGSGTTTYTTGSDTSGSSDSISSGTNTSTAAGANPNTGISMGYVASAAVLAAMGVVVTAVKRRDD